MEGVKKDMKKGCEGKRRKNKSDLRKDGEDRNERRWKRVRRKRGRWERFERRRKKSIEDDEMMKRRMKE